MGIRSILGGVEIKETGWIVETRPSVASGEGFTPNRTLSQAVLSSGDLITYTSTMTGYVLTRFNYYGNIVFAKGMGLGTYRMLSGKLAVDAADNIYTVSTIDNPSYPLRDISLRKYDSSGTFLWEKLINSTDNDGENGFKIINGYIYIILSSSVYSLLKLDLDGNFQFIKRFTLAGGSGRPVAFHINSNNVLLLGYAIYNTSYATDNAGWVTFNLNNNSYMSSVRYTSSSTMIINQMHIDDSSTIYIAAKIGIATILKYNSGGALVWRKGIIPQTSSAYDISITSSHIYVSGNWPNTANSGFEVSKYTFAGVFVSRLSFGVPSNYTFYPVINVLASEVMYASCISNNYQCVVKGRMGNALFTGGGAPLEWAVSVGPAGEGTSTAQAPTVSSPGGHTIVAGTAPTITTTTTVSMVDMALRKWTKILY
jgi:hypothetical protein